MFAFVLRVLGLSAVAALASARGLISLSALEIAAITTCSVAFGILYAAVYPFWFSPLRHLPIPEGSNVVTGHSLKILLGSQPFQYIWGWSERMTGAPFLRILSFGNREALIPLSTEAIRGVLQTHAYSFDKSHELKTLLMEFMGGGVLFAMGDTHKRMRKVLGGPFSKPSVRNMLPSIRQSAAEMTEILDRKIRGPEKGILAAADLFKEVALNTIGRVALGTRLTTMTSKAAGLTFEQCYYEFLEPPRFGALLMFLNIWLPLRWLPIETNRKFAKAAAEMRSMVEELIQERYAEAVSVGEEAAKTSMKPDMLSKLIMANLGDKSISDSELRELVVQLILAGHDTASVAMTWICAELVRAPHVATRLRQEFADARSKQPELDALAIENLPYLHNVVRETLRNNPPTIVLHWEAIQDIEVEGCLIRKGTLMHIYPSVIHRNKAIWGDDADKFNPDRWDDLSETAGNVFAYEAFLNGPRICPGIPLALLEMKVLTMELLDNFDFELADENKGPEYEFPALALKTKDGLQLRVRRRDPEQGLL